MRVFLLGFLDSHIYEETTAMRLANHGNFFFKRGLNKKEKYCEEDVLIRYGSYSYASYDKLFGRVVNRARSIRNNCNKLNTHVKLLEHGFKVPKIFLTKEEIEETDLPIIRRNARHSRASDIKIITSMDNFIKGSYYAELIPSVEEFRFHIMFNSCVRISKKVPKKKQKKTSDIIRSSTTGWTFIDSFKHNVELENLAIEECLKALTFLRLDFGACDVIINKENGLPYLLEVNTCPRLGSYGREVYVKEFLNELNLPSNGIKLGKVKDYEFDSLMMKYRQAMRHKPSKEDLELEA